MTALFVVLGVLFWFGLGYIGSRVMTISFEAKFGEGTTDTVLSIFGFVLGPIGFLTSVFSAFQHKEERADWKAALGLSPVVQRPNDGYCYLIDKRRNTVSKFFTIGVKGLPDFDETTEAQVARYPLLANDIRFERLTGLR